MGNNAKSGDLPCTESKSICLLRFAVNICCSFFVNLPKSILSPKPNPYSSLIDLYQLRRGIQISSIGVSAPLYNSPRIGLDWWILSISEIPLEYLISFGNRLNNFFLFGFGVAESDNINFFAFLQSEDNQEKIPELSLLLVQQVVHSFLEFCGV